MNKGNYFDIDENGSFVTENPQHCYDKHLNDFLLNFLKNKDRTALKYLKDNGSA